MLNTYVRVHRAGSPMSLKTYTFKECSVVASFVATLFRCAAKNEARDFHHHEQCFLLVFVFLLGCKCLFCFFLSSCLYFFGRRLHLNGYVSERYLPQETIIIEMANGWNCWENGLCIDCSSEAEGIDKDQSSC